MENCSVIDKVYIFKELTLEELDKIKKITSSIEIKTGQKLFSEND
jgi:hypothetical protein